MRVNVLLMARCCRSEAGCVVCSGSSEGNENADSVTRWHSQCVPLSNRECHLYWENRYCMVSMVIHVLIIDRNSIYSIVLEP